MTARLHKAVPRGVLNLGDRAIAIARAVDEGTPQTQVARDFGVSRSYVVQCVAAVIEAEKDADNRRGLAV